MPIAIHTQYSGLDRVFGTWTVVSASHIPPRSLDSQSTMGGIEILINFGWAPGVPCADSSSQPERAVITVKHLNITYRVRQTIP